jgi:hypothetical protein
VPIVTLRRSRAGNERIESLIRVAGLHQNLGTYFEQGKANSFYVEALLRIQRSLSEPATVDPIDGGK